MSRQSTHRGQYEALVSMLTERPDIAQGFPNSSKEDVQSFWEEVSVKLNSLGPPVKDTTTWKKVWLDYKSYIKRKLSTNKSESRATGGGLNKMHMFTDIEETVIRLTGLETSTSGIKGVQRFGVERSSSITEGDTAAVFETPGIIDCSMESQPEEVPTVSKKASARSREDSSPQALLQTQIKLQKDFYKDFTDFARKTEDKMNEIAKSFSLLCAANETIAKTQLELLEETRRHNRAMEDLKREEINKIFMEDRVNN